MVRLRISASAWIRWNVWSVDLRASTVAFFYPLCLFRTGNATKRHTRPSILLFWRRRNSSIMGRFKKWFLTQPWGVSRYWIKSRERCWGDVAFGFVRKDSISEDIEGKEARSDYFQRQKYDDCTWNNALRFMHASTKFFTSRLNAPMQNDSNGAGILYVHGIVTVLIYHPWSSSPHRWCPRRSTTT